MWLKICRRAFCLCWITKDKILVRSHCDPCYPVHFITIVTLPVQQDHWAHQNHLIWWSTPKKEILCSFWKRERERETDSGGGYGLWVWVTERNWFSLFHVLLFQGLALWVWLVTGMPEMNILAPSGFGMNTSTCTCYCNIWTFTQYENIISHVSETSPKMTPGVTQYWYQGLVSSS